MKVREWGNGRFIVTAPDRPWVAWLLMRLGFRRIRRCVPLSGIRAQTGGGKP